MEIILHSLFILFFLYINFLIIHKDVKIRVIPNKYLLYLFIGIIVYNILIGNIFFLTLGSILTILSIFIIGFLIFHFGIWGAGDVKYFLVLYLLIQEVNILAFLLFISLTFSLYILISYFYFYLKPAFMGKEDRKKFIMSLIDVKFQEIKSYYSNLSKREIYYEIFKSINIFFIIFISMRILRIIIIESGESSELIGNLLNDYFLYLLLALILVGTAIFLLLRHIALKIKEKISQIYPFKDVHFQLLLNLVFIVSILFLVVNNYLVVNTSFANLLMISFSIFIIIKILIITMKLVLQVNEVHFVKISELKKGMVIDYGWMKNLIKKQEMHYKDLYYPKKVLDDESIKSIEHIVDFQNNLPGLTGQKIVHIPIMNTIAFSIFIFLGFILSLIFGDLIIEKLKDLTEFLIYLFT